MELDLKRKQTDRVTAAVQKLLSRQFGERTAPVCQHGSLNANKATLQLFGTNSQTLGVVLVWKYKKK